MTVMLEVRALHAYYGQAHILFEVGLEVHAGEVVVLLGRNGAGKSTTLKSIAGLLRPRQGLVRFQGERIDGLEPFVIARKGLGYVPEDRRIFTELTVLENLEVGRQAPRAGVPVWNFARIGKLFPNLAEMPHRPGGRMSGGEQQMLTIARTLMGNPSCILLDEPSEGVAPVIVASSTRWPRRSASSSARALRYCFRNRTCTLPRRWAIAPLSSKRVGSRFRAAWRP